MFLGTYNHSLDSKNRLTIPSKILLQLTDKNIIVSKGFEGCLELRTCNNFETYMKRLLALSQNKLSTRTLLRQFMANASDIEIDSANRILIPLNLLNEAKITKNIVIIGLGDKCEIWDQEAYELFKKNSDNLLEELAEGINDEQF